MLNSKNVDYLLIGGYAVGYHGYPRATNDLDIWIAIHPENANQMVSVMREFGFDLPELSVDSFLKERQIIRLGNPPIRIEILTVISGVDFSECYAECVIDTIDGVEVNIISLPRLIENKKANGRFKDLDDLEHLS